MYRAFLRGEPFFLPVADQPPQVADRFGRIDPLKHAGAFHPVNPSVADGRSAAKPGRPAMVSADSVSARNRITSGELCTRYSGLTGPVGSASPDVFGPGELEQVAEIGVAAGAFVRRIKLEINPPPFSARRRRRIELRLEFRDQRFSFRIFPRRGSHGADKPGVIGEPDGRKHGHRDAVLLKQLFQGSVW